MTAVAGMKVSTTLLADLPGNKMANAGGAKQGIPYRKCLQIKVRRTAPSEHFIKASDRESSSDESSSSEEEDLSTSRTATNPYRVGDSISSFKPFKMTIPSTMAPSKKPSFMKQTNRVSSSSDESSSEESLVEESDFETTRNRPIPTTIRYHAWSESKERRLLNHLIDYDEEENDRVNGVQTDDDFYLMWKCGAETRRTSKAGPEPATNKRAKTSKISSRTKNTPIKKDVKPDTFCGWETIYSKKPIQKLKEERKQRLSQPNNSLYASKFSTSTEKGGDFGPPYMFFHYTDTARYIQQYRRAHTCENPYSNHPGCNHDMTSSTGFRDMNFPFKFDLNTGSIRQRLINRGVLNNARGMGFEPAAVEEEPGMRAGNPATAGYLSPVSFRPPYSLKSHATDNWNYLPESPSRLKYQLKKIWRSYEQKSAGSQTDMKVFNEDSSLHPNHLQRPLSDLSKADDVNLASLNGHDGADVTKRLEYQASLQQSGDAIVGKQNNAIAHLRELKLEENCLQVKEKTNRNHGVSAAINDYDVGLFESESAEETKARYEQEKNNRMRSLIVAEINNIQKKQVINVEQKRKLDKFKDALNAMSTGALDKSVLPPSGSATKRFISGSVRAYYTRTTNARTIDNFRTDSIRCGPELDSNLKSDDKPIILVSQPHLRHLASKPKKPEPPLLAKKLIGGRVMERNGKHPADAKQFTRITDLLRIKERQQSGRRALPGSARGTPLGSASRKRPSPYGERHNRQKGENSTEHSRKL